MCDVTVAIWLAVSLNIDQNGLRTLSAANQEPSNRLSNPSLNGVVSLNVGGTKFETTRQTFLNDPNSMLAKMFDPVSPMQPGDLKFIVPAPSRWPKISVKNKKVCCHNLPLFHYQGRK